MDDYKDSPSALIADVDCTTGGQSLCEKHGVRGYPSIKWGDPSNLEDYNGGRDFNALKKFADENLGPTCGPDNLDLCDEDSKKMIGKFQKMDIDELEEKIGDFDKKIKKIEDEGQKKVDKLQSKIRELNEKIESENKKKDDKLSKESKKLGLPFMKAVQASRQ